MSGRRWTAEEAALLEAMYGNVAVEQIAARLGRSVPAVFIRAQARHLGPDRPPGAMTLNELMRTIGVSGHQTVRGWIAYGWLVATRSPRYGRADRPGWIVRAEDLVAFLRQHPQLLDRDKVDPAYRQFLPERWITLPEAFKRGAAHPGLLEGAVLAGLVPEARRRGEKGTWWVIPESTLPRLIDARRRFTPDPDWRRQRLRYLQDQRHGRLSAMKRRVTSISQARADARANSQHSARNVVIAS